MNLHDAIYKLNPTVVTIRGDVAYDKDDNVVNYDASAAQALVTSMGYVSKRALDYPSIAEFADAYYWSQKGNAQPMADYIAKCDAVKAKYPKTGS
jgi:hypothetical protein